MTIATVAVPAALAAVLSYVFQFAKPLLETVPSMRPSDASHNDALRLVYGVLAFLAVGGYVLGTSPMPVGLDAWISLLLSVLTTAVTMTVGAHYLYRKVRSGGAGSAPATPAPSTPSDFPPGAPNVAALGLPTQ